jgi:hypothetical protein
MNTKEQEAYLKEHLEIGKAMKFVGELGCTHGRGFYVLPAGKTVTFTGTQSSNRGGMKSTVYVFELRAPIAIRLVSNAAQVLTALGMEH